MMKSLMKTISVLAFVLFSLSACKKNKENQPKPKEKMFAVTMQLEAQDSDPQKAILVGTQSELESIFDGKNRMGSIKKIADHNLVFAALRTGVGSWPTNPVSGDPGGPVGGNPAQSPCVKEIMSLFDTHHEEWQQEANSTCKVVTKVVECPSFVYNTPKGPVSPDIRVFTFYPTSPKCLVLPEMNRRVDMTPFEFGQDEYDSEEVKEYINKIAL